MHKKIILILSYSIFHLITNCSIAQPIKLPYQSNVYPDTFAIYWHVEKIDERNAKETTIKIGIDTMFGDKAIDMEESYDSLVAIPYYIDYTDETCLVITVDFILNRKHLYTRDSYQLKVMPINSKTEALIKLVNTNATPSNLLMLAEVYEQEKCFVNAYYIFKRLTSLNPTLGNNEFSKFYYQRNYTVLKKSNDVSR